MVCEVLKPTRVVTWNCQGGLRKKWRELSALKPDIAVVQEATAADLEVLLGDKEVSGVWCGPEKKKGLAVFGFNQWGLKSLPTKIEQKLFHPVVAKKGEETLKLLGVWAMPSKKSHEDSYAGQVYDLIQKSSAKVKAFDLIVGDFNASSRWDGTRRKKTFTALAEELSKRGFESAYHGFHKVAFDDEKHPTFFMYRDRAKTYHIDYCFVGAKLRSHRINVSIGQPNLWLAYSDHAPLVVDLLPHGRRV